MKLKQFLNPTTGTIMWFLVIFILFVPFAELKSSETLISLAIYITLLLGKGYVSVSGINYLIFLFGIIASYILGAAFNVFIINKKKTKKKK